MVKLNMGFFPMNEYYSVKEEQRQNNIHAQTWVKPSILA